jgi:uncharacterized Ntn-hydrolase superfamily protein
VTFSIVARDPEGGDLGVAVASRFLAVGGVVPWARAGVGAIATQAFANVRFGPDGLELLAAGTDASTVLTQLLAADDLREERQVGIVDAGGRSANHTGRDCFDWAGGRTGEGYAAQGNILAGPRVIDAMVERYSAGGAAFPELLLATLAAGDAAGGDRRGRESAAILVVREAGGYGGGNDRWLDLRVDDHADPIPELARLVELQRLYFDRPAPSDLIPLDTPLATELRDALTVLGVARGQAAAFPINPVRPAIGEPRPAPEGWDDTWQAALMDWMSMENLEERAAAAGWIDPRVLDYVRRRAEATIGRPASARRGRETRAS